jgi:DNA-binding transcriptional LysR family regulator
MLDAWTLHVLVEVADRGSFSAAGEALSMTQPAVSRQIAGLERRVGVPLFRRVPRGVRPTAAGEIATGLARDILARLRVLEARLGTFTSPDAGHLRLTAFPSANTSFVPTAIRRFSNAHPGVTVSLGQVDPGGPLAAVRDARVDLALLTAWDLPPNDDPNTAPGNALDGVDLVPLLDEELRVALPTAHPLAGRARVRLRDLREDTWIEGAHPDCLGPIPRLTEALGGPPRIGFVCDDWTGKHALVSAGAGIMLVPTLAEAAIRRGVVLRPTSPRLPARRLYAAAAAAPFRLPTVTAMLAVLSTMARHPGPSGL